MNALDNLLAPPANGHSRINGHAFHGLLPSPSGPATPVNDPLADAALGADGPSLLDRLERTARKSPGELPAFPAHVLPAALRAWVEAEATATQTDTLTEGVVLGLVTGIGFALPMVGVEAAFDPNKPKPLNWFLITAAYHMIGFVILGAVIGAWQ